MLKAQLRGLLAIHVEVITKMAECEALDGTAGRKR
jgi:hypothetical protein